MFEALAGGADAGADTYTDTQAVADGQSSLSKVIFHPASGIDETAVAQLQATLRTRILRPFVGRALLESFEAKEIGRCACDAIQNRAHGQPVVSTVCHCKYCQRRLASAFAILVTFTEQSVEITHTQLAHRSA